MHRSIYGSHGEVREKDYTMDDEVHGEFDELVVKRIRIKSSYSFFSHLLPRVKNIVYNEETVLAGIT